MKTYVLYHANCFDGFGAAFAAWLRYQDRAEYIPVRQANRLFYVGTWPKNHRDAYESAKSYAERAKIGAARVSTFIRTRGKV